MARRNFDKPTKRAALKRSGGRCEAVGEWYGLEPGERCMGFLSYGVEFDHVDCHANSRDSSLENCAAICPRCHRYKTAKIDIPKAAKTVRQQDKDNSIRTVPRQKIASRPFPRSTRRKALWLRGESDAQET